jgi:hypothetical protein
MIRCEFEDFIEPFAMGTLRDFELTDFETHLLLCQQCQEGVTSMDWFLDALKSAFAGLKRNEIPGPLLAAPSNTHFLTHLPQYSLEAAAGKFGKQMTVEPEGWVEVHTDRPLTKDMFVTHVKGHSMEPKIPDGSLCAFRSHIVGSFDGKVLLVEDYSESEGKRYSVKICRIASDSGDTERANEAWLHQRVTLESLDPAYKPWSVTSAAKVRPIGEFLFVV